MPGKRRGRRLRRRASRRKSAGGRLELVQCIYVNLFSRHQNSFFSMIRILHRQET